MIDRELMQQALDAMLNFPNDISDEMFKAMKVLKARLAQPEPEPVFAFRRKGLNDFCTCSEHRYNELAQKPNVFEVKKFYTAPPQREWQGLTDEEIGDIIEASQITLKNYCSEDKQTEYARAIEAKLKEKNT
jgi:hypothetical protein